MTEAEVKRLIWVAQESRKTYSGSEWKLNPTDRVLLYSIALYTGLRSIEIASLRVSSFNMETKTLTVEASNTKNRKKASLPIHPTLMELLKPVILSNPHSSPSVLLFLGPLIVQGMCGKVFWFIRLFGGHNWFYIGPEPLAVRTRMSSGGRSMAWLEKKRGQRFLLAFRLNGSRTVTSRQLANGPVSI